MNTFYLSDKHGHHSSYEEPKPWSPLKFFWVLILGSLGYGVLYSIYYYLTH
jgi:hypothetical protein